MRCGTIPEGHYGAGEVSIWDQGTFQNLDPAHSISEGIAAGKLSFALHGGKINGRFALVRMRGKGKRENWLLIKGKDEHARFRSAGGKTTHAARKAPRANAKSTRGAAAPKEVELTNLDKVLYPDEGITKADVASVYRAVAARLLPFLKDQPVTLERLPDGLGEGKPHFWQKNTPVSYPAWIPRVELETERGKPVAYALINDLPTLLYMAGRSVAEAGVRGMMRGQPVVIPGLQNKREAKMPACIKPVGQSERLGPPGYGLFAARMARTSSVRNGKPRPKPGIERLCDGDGAVVGRENLACVLWQDRRFDPLPPDPLGRQHGESAARAGRWAEAAESFARYVRRNPKEASAWYDLLMAQLGAGQKEASQRTCVISDYLTANAIALRRSQQ